MGLQELANKREERAKQLHTLITFQRNETQSVKVASTSSIKTALGVVPCSVAQMFSFDACSFFATRNDLNSKLSYVDLDCETQNQLARERTSRRRLEVEAQVQHKINPQAHRV